MPSFTSYALSKRMIGALKAQGYVNATPIQDAVIPKALKGDSLVARAPTGTGKTHAFLIPIIDKIDVDLKAIQVIIVAPTRELAKQTYDFAKRFTDFYPALRILLLSSGEERSRTVDKLVHLPQLIIATPGRLKDLAVDAKTVNFLTAKTVVLDEADMLMDMGFFDDLNLLISNLDHPQVMVFSATIPEKLTKAIERYTEADHVIDIGASPIPEGKVTHTLIDIRHQDVHEAVLSFINEKHPYFLLIFASRIPDVVSLYEYLRAHRIDCGLIHGDLETRERKAMMRRIREDEFPVVVASDMAARGIDLPSVSHILSIDFPRDLEFYFHRAGRTGRNGENGECYAFYDNDHTAAPLALINRGVHFNYLAYRDGHFVEGKPIEPKVRFKKKGNPELDKELRKVAGLAKSKTVKPGYKKKVRVAVERAKARHRRAVIKRDIRRQQVERYKQAGKGE